MKKKLFGNDIEVSCAYCQYSIKNGTSFLCCKKKEIKKGNCRKFVYNPTLRQPKIQLVTPSQVQEFKLDDFVL